MYLGENLGVMIDDNGSNPLLGRGGFFRPLARVVAPPAPVAPVTPAVPPTPVFTNIDNSAYWAQQSTTSQKDAPNGQALPAGIKAVDYTEPPPVKVDYVKVGLYAVGALGVIMLLTRKRR